MATLGSYNLTLQDVAARKDPNGSIADIAEVMNDDHQILDVAVLRECNDGTNNKTTARTGIPDPTWRKLYGGVQSTKSETSQVVDSCGMLEALPKIDVDVIDKSGDPKAARFSEEMPHIEGIKQAVESKLIYGDTKYYPEQFMGLAPRYNKYCRSTPNRRYSDYNVLTAAGAGSDNTSIWLITWGDNFTHFIFPKGSKAGLSQEDKGKLLVSATDSSGEFFAYVNHYKWDVGLTVRDWRANGRICNIDVSNLVGESSAADLVKLMIQLEERVKGAGGKQCWLMNPRVKTMLRIQALSKSQYTTTFESVEGREIMRFAGKPVYTSEQILLTESALTQAS